MSEALLHVYDSPFFLSLSLMLSNTHSYNTVPILPSLPNFSTSHWCTCPVLHLLGVIKGSSEEPNSAPGMPMSFLPRHILRQASLSPYPTPHSRYCPPTAPSHLSCLLPKQGFSRICVLRRSSMFLQVGETEDWLNPHLPPSQAFLGSGLAWPSEPRPVYNIAAH